MQTSLQPSGRSCRGGIPFLLALAVVVALFASCRGISNGLSTAGGASPSPSPSASYLPQPGPSVVAPPVGSGYANDNLFLYVGAVPLSAANPAPKSLTAKLHALGDWSQPCLIGSAAAPTDLSCIYEIDEMDMYTLGMQYYLNNKIVDDRLYITYNVPTGMYCPYFEFRPFYYWQFQPGVGPSVVTDTINGNNPPVFADTSGDGANATVDSVNGNCTKDYSHATEAGPNCCVGSYTLVTINCPLGSPCSTSEATQDWGGNWSSCLGGPAADKDLWPYETVSEGWENNFPQFLWTDLSQVGGSLEGSFPFGGGRSKNWGTNAYSANYFDVPNPPTDYGNPTLWPRAIQGPGMVASAQFAGGEYAFPNGDGYEMACLDHAGNMLQRIRLFIRPWSDNSQFVSASLGGPNNWMLGTAQGIPFSDQPELNFGGWFNFSAAFGWTLPNGAANPAYNFLTQYPGFNN